ncbi:MAG: phosphoglycerate kinase [Candidatus Pacebacteria bacterium]|nr:phosphoglycerate kinase [Candidatus Paceibacterota bacterium]
MELPSIADLKITDKRVLLRADFDVPLIVKEEQVLVADDTRLRQVLKTVNWLIKKKSKLIIMAHLGRPGGKRVAALSLRPVARAFSKLLPAKIKWSFSPFVLGKKAEKKAAGLKPGEILILENLRFYPEEEKNTRSFAGSLAGLADVFVNEAFAVSHREHSSIVGVPQFLPAALGFNFLKEARILGQTFKNPRRPVVVVLGGRKKSKAVAGQILLGWADAILVGGELVELNGIVELATHHKVKANLTKNGEDITPDSAQEFAQIIKGAGTVIWSGPMGAYETPCYRKGTAVVARAIVDSRAFSIIGGGDTEAALTKLGLVDKVDYVCSGGGAMLDFLAQRGTLPGIEAIRGRKNRNAEI